MTRNLLRAAWMITSVAFFAHCTRQNAKAPGEEPTPSTLSPADLRAKVEALLSGSERISTEEDWKPLGPAALGALEEIYADAAALPARRTRAVASMAQVDHPQAEARLQAIIADPATEPPYRSTAVLALAHRTGERALPTIQPMLEHPDATMRDAAARALGRVGTAEARKSLEERLGREEDASVREAIQLSLTKMEP